MSFVAADPISLGIFCIFSIVMGVLMIWGLAKTSKFYFWLGILTFFLGFVAVAATSGLIKQHPIPMAPIVFAGVFLTSFAFAFSKGGNDLSQLPLWLLVGFQSFRFPLELILHRWAEISTIPHTMTWTGSNWDIAAGLISLLGMFFVNRSRMIAWGVQLIGFLLLVNVIRVVIMSSPFPFSWPLDRPLQLVMYFPYVLIGPLFVMPALTIHLVVFRKLIRGT